MTLIQFCQSAFPAHFTGGRIVSQVLGMHMARQKITPNLLSEQGRFLIIAIDCINFIVLLLVDYEATLKQFYKTTSERSL